MGSGSYSATSNNMKLVHWPLMGGLLHLVQRGGDWVCRSVTFGFLLTNVTFWREKHRLRTLRKESKHSHLITFLCLFLVYRDNVYK